MKKILLATILLFGLYACSEEAEPVPQPVEEEQVKQEPVKQEEVVEEEPVDLEPDNSMLEEFQLATFQEAFNGIAEVEFADGTYYITPDPNGTFGLELLMMLEGTMDSSPWDDLVYNTVMVSEQIRTTIGEGYSIVIVNPENPDNLLLLVTDGIILYDVMNE